MYYSNNKNPNNYRKPNPGRRGNFRGQMIKTFDPSQIASLPPQTIEDNKYVVINKFSDFFLSEILKANICSKGYKDPTPIQDQTIPVILAGKDIIGMANTGTGKTAAFLIPLIEKVTKDKNQRILILTPTRELASQIRDEFYALSKNLGIRSALCIGGTNMWKQKEDLKRNPNFVIGTPGRLKDHMDKGYLNLSRFGSVVLDEADHMVDVGFIGTIKFMISAMSANRQSLFFSATVNEKVESIIHNFVKNPVTISVKNKDITTQVKQEIVKIAPPNTKIEELNRLLNKTEFEKVLIFGRTKHGVQKLADNLTKRGYKAGAIHGNKKQSQRTKILSDFKNNYIQILIATDVASRGIDIPDVSHVINYDLPESYESYIHRIGRTGRADKIGTALTFVE